MTTAQELQEMIREEMNEALDYARIDAKADELKNYNKGFRTTCEIALIGSGADGWAESAIKHFEGVDYVYSGVGDAYFTGRRAAYDWILQEVKSLDPDDTVTISRARYNYLLEVERDAHDFAAKFAEWGES